MREGLFLRVGRLRRRRDGERRRERRRPTAEPGGVVSQLDLVVAGLSVFRLLVEVLVQDQMEMGREQSGAREARAAERADGRTEPDRVTDLHAGVVEVRVLEHPAVAEIDRDLDAVSRLGADADKEDGARHAGDQRLALIGVARPARPVVRVVVVAEVIPLADAVPALLADVRAALEDPADRRALRIDRHALRLLDNRARARAGRVVVRGDRGRVLPRAGAPDSGCEHEARGERRPARTCARARFAGAQGLAQQRCFHDSLGSYGTQRRCVTTGDTRCACGSRGSLGVAGREATERRELLFS